MPGKRIQHLFVVRMWAETAAETAAETTALPGPADWHGLVQHVPTGQKLYFASLADMTDFIEARLGLETGPPICPGLDVEVAAPE